MLEGAHGKGLARRSRQKREPAGLATAAGGHCHRPQWATRLPRRQLPPPTPGTRATGRPGRSPRPPPQAKALPVPGGTLRAPGRPEGRRSPPPRPALPSPSRRMRTSRFMAAPPPLLPGPPPPPPSPPHFRPHQRAAAQSGAGRVAPPAGAQHSQTSCLPLSMFY